MPYFNSGKRRYRQSLTIKYSCRDVDERVSNEIRSGLGKKRYVIGLNAHTGEACFTVYYSKFNMLIVPGYFSIIPLRRNFYRPRNYLLWRSIEISFAAYVVCRSLISSLRHKIYLSKTISLPSLRYYGARRREICPKPRVYNFLPA